MSFPWKKKSKINRGVSRFVNDIRASKRGESLVVQTGFPTSLIDLIVKNRNRLNKSSSIPTKKNRSYSTHFDIESTPILNQHTLNAINTFQADTREHNLILNSDEKLLDEAVYEGNDDADKHFSELEECDSGKEISILNDDGKIICDDQNQDGGVNKVLGKNRIPVIVIKVIFVLILAVATKKIAMALTLLSFLLITLENFFNSCASERKRLLTVPTQVGEKESLRLILVEESNVMTDFTNFQEQFRDMIKESLTPKIDLTDEDEREHQFSALDRGIEVSKEGEQTVIGRRDSAKLKAMKFKNFVTKKFGGESRYRRRNKQGTIGQCIAQSTDSNSEETYSNGDTGEEDNEEEDITDRDVLVDVSKPCLDTRVQGNSGRTRNWRWNTCIPVVSVLVGLVGGRTMALVLSIVCILLHRLSGGTKR